MRAIVHPAIGNRVHVIGDSRFVLLVEIYEVRFPSEIQRPRDAVLGPGGATVHNLLHSQGGTMRNL